jgi:CRP/FNR family transcriptional regulator
MFRIASYEEFHDGQVIIQEGTHGDWIYVVEEGFVEISKKVQGRQIVVAVLSKGEIFGELAFISGLPRTATVKSIGETTVGVIDKDYFTREYNKLPADFRQIFTTVSVRLKKMTDVFIASHSNKG